jgi:hypothetical protein
VVGVLADLAGDGDVEEVHEATLRRNTRAL